MHTLLGDVVVVVVFSEQIVIIFLSFFLGFSLSGSFLFSFLLSLLSELFLPSV